MTACTAPRYGDHDYSQPPHTTPEKPRVAEHDDWNDCWSQHHGAEPRCAHRADYEVTVYQAGTHEWVWLLACEPCVAAIRVSHARNGPGGTQGVARVRSYDPSQASIA